MSEAEMVASGSNLKADVLKVGCHGSSSSTTFPFLKAVSPKYAVISGHPSEEVLRRLKEAGATVYRTDVHGTVVADSDGKTVKFTTSKSEGAVVSAPAQSNEDVIIYITRTGSKYHRAGCRYLARSCIPISLSEAKKLGYTPCSVCRPPM